MAVPNRILPRLGCTIGTALRSSNRFCFALAAKGCSRAHFPNLRLGSLFASPRRTNLPLYGWVLQEDMEAGVARCNALAALG